MGWRYEAGAQWGSWHCGAHFWSGTIENKIVFLEWTRRWQVLRRKARQGMVGLESKRGPQRTLTWGRDLKAVRKRLSVICRERVYSKWREWQVQRPWGRSTPGMFEAEWRKETGVQKRPDRRGDQITRVGHCEDLSFIWVRWYEFIQRQTYFWRISFVFLRVKVDTFSCFVVSFKRKIAAYYLCQRAFLVAQMVKNLPTMQDTQACCPKGTPNCHLLFKTTWKIIWDLFSHHQNFFSYWFPPPPQKKNLQCKRISYSDLWTGTQVGQK